MTELSKTSPPREKGPKSMPHRLLYKGNHHKKYLSTIPKQKQLPPGAIAKCIKTIQETTKKVDAAAQCITIKIAELVCEEAIEHNLDEDCILLAVGRKGGSIQKTQYKGNPVNSFMKMKSDEHNTGEFIIGFKIAQRA
jgi:hypothetical protein